MYKVLLVLASAAALKRPQRGLAVRGGELGLNADTAIQVGTWVTGLSGAMAYVDPKGNLENYGITTAQASGIDNMRWAGANQLTLAAIFAADPEQAVGLSGYYAAWNLIASAPATLATGFPKAAIYGWAAVCAGRGKAALPGDASRGAPAGRGVLLYGYGYREDLPSWPSRRPSARMNQVTIGDSSLVTPGARAGRRVRPCAIRLIESRTNRRVLKH